MGKVIVKDVILRNHEDEILVKSNYLPEEKVREKKLNMIADTETVEIGLPQSLVDKLGLPFEKEVNSRLADGTKQKRRMYRDLTVCIGDRKAYVPCIAKPEGAPLLLGQTVFEHMSLVVDCKNNKIMPHPDELDGMMLFEDY